MLIFDQLNKADRHLRALSWCIAAGLAVLLAGLWWVQVVRSRHYVEDLRNQSYRTVRVPAPRGKILDRKGVALAENRPAYSISLYLEDRSWRDAVQQQYKRTERAARESALVPRKPKTIEKFLSWFGYEPALTQARRLTPAEKTKLGREARYSVTSNIVWQLGVALRQPLAVDETKFHRHYDRRRALPLPIVASLNAEQIARFQEQSIHLPGVDMEMQPLRVYPQGSLAAQVVGCLTHFDDASAEGELASFNYHLPDYRGYDGIEASFDAQLRGRAGGKSVLVNNLGYRQNETILSPIEAGKNVTLTIDAEIQRVAERELKGAHVHQKPNRGAAVVLDVRTGEIIAMASVPAYEPKDWVPRLPQEVWNTYTNEDIAPMRNRCIYGNYFPGSTFKTVVALAGLEAGVIDPNKVYRSLGYYQLGRRRIDDTAGPGEFDFKRAYKKSSNPYFIEYGLQVGREAIVAMGEHLHLGERTGVPLSQEVRGVLPTLDYIRKNLGGWHEGDTANLSIGQAVIEVTPLQMAVATAAIASGGKVLWPQLIISAERQDALIDPASRQPLQPRLRDRLPVSNRTLSIIQAAMLADTEDADGTGTRARVPGYRVCGKTGTAQVFKRTKFDHWTVWFASYAPYEDPRYAVVVMVDYGVSGGESCAPVAREIYRALKYRDERGPAAPKNSVVLK